MDWFDLLAVQGTLKSLLQHHSSKASILLRSAFFIVQLSYPYMTSEKTIALTRRTFVGKVMSLLFNMLSRLVLTFLPRSKRLLILCLQSPSAVILEPRRIKSATVSPSICHEVMGPDAMILVFWILSFKPTFSHSSFTFMKDAHLNMTQHLFFMKLSSQNDHDLHTQAQCQLVQGLKRQNVSQIIFFKYYYKFNFKNKPNWIKLLSYIHATKVTTKWLETVIFFFKLEKVKTFTTKEYHPPVSLKKLCNSVLWSQVYAVSPQLFMGPLLIGSFSGMVSVARLYLLPQWCQAWLHDLIWPMEYEQKWHVPLPSWGFTAGIVIPPLFFFLFVMTMCCTREESLL